MKKLFVAILMSVYIFGCASTSNKILPPIYDVRHPFILGILDPLNPKDSTVTSILVDIVGKSELVSGFLCEPLDKSQVDFFLRVDKFAVKKRKSGLLQTKCENHGSLVVSLLDPEQIPLANYEENGTWGNRSFNLFSTNEGIEFLTSSLVTRVLDRVSEDLEGGLVKFNHRIEKEDKELKYGVTFKYPDIKHFKRRSIHIKSKLLGTQPPEDVNLELINGGGNRKVSHKLYFESLRNVTSGKEWSFVKEVSLSEIPFNTKLYYRVVSSDIEGNKFELAKGNFKTISSELFRLKQVEVLTQGTIITSFAGLFVVMIMYSI